MFNSVQKEYMITRVFRTAVPRIHSRMPCPVIRTHATFCHAWAALVGVVNKTQLPDSPYFHFDVSRHICSSDRFRMVGMCIPTLRILEYNEKQKETEIDVANLKTLGVVDIKAEFKYTDVWIVYRLPPLASPSAAHRENPKTPIAVTPETHRNRKAINRVGK